MDWLPVTLSLGFFALGWYTRGRFIRHLAQDQETNSRLKDEVAQAKRQAEQADLIRAFERQRAEAALAEMKLVREKVIQLQFKPDMPESMRKEFASLREELHRVRDHLSSVPPPQNPLPDSGGTPP